MRLLLIAGLFAAALGAASTFLPSADELERESASRMLAVPVQECMRLVRERNPGAAVFVENQQHPGPTLVALELRAGDRQYACSAVWTADGRSVPFISERRD